MRLFVRKLAWGPTMMTENPWWNWHPDYRWDIGTNYNENENVIGCQIHLDESAPLGKPTVSVLVVVEGGGGGGDT